MKTFITHLTSKLEIIELRPRQWLGVLIFVTFHLIISHVFLPNLRKADLYPFYDWNIFSYTRPNDRLYTLLIEEVDGKVYNPPVVLYGNSGMFTSLTPKLAYHQIRRLGRAIMEESRAQNIPTLRQEMENNIFFRLKSARYQLIYREINYREFLMNPDTSQFQSIQSFEYKDEENYN
jgi:hypothetical protein